MQYARADTRLDPQSIYYVVRLLCTVGYTRAGIFQPGVLAGAEPKVVHFPSEDESKGTVSIGWRGPRCEHFGRNLDSTLSAMG